MKRRQFLATAFLALFSGKTLATPNEYELAAEEVVDSLTKQLSEEGYNWKQSLGFVLDSSIGLDTKVRVYHNIDIPSLPLRSGGFFATVFIGKDPAHNSLTDFLNVCTKRYTQTQEWFDGVNREVAKLLTARGYC